ncbi:MAG: hypothetical protein ACPGXK_01825 [Phycisphaerae bacterium]
MTEPGEILTIDAKWLEAPLEQREAVAWFYGELCSMGEPRARGLEAAAREWAWMWAPPEPAAAEANRDRPDGADEPATTMALPEGTVDVLIYGTVRSPLWILFRDNPAIESVRRRATVMVDALDEVSVELDDLRYDYERCRGISLTDLSLDLLDPAGNRVHIRQRWSKV